MLPPIASRFVAGEDVDRAISHAQSQERRNVGVILNLLGEHYTDTADAEDDTQVYLDIVERLADTTSRTCISIKPSQIGLDIDTDVFRRNVERIVDAAAGEDIFVWIDMEDNTTTDATLDTFAELSERYGDGVGVCVQANLKRTGSDLERLAELPGKVRLVKGAYNESETVAYQTKSQVNEAYQEYLEYMFREFEGGIAVGSHDPEMISFAQKLYDEYGTDFEIQMLMGVREDAQYDLADEYPVWQYEPFGSRWLSYFYRRIMERKENVLFAVRAIFSR